MATSTTERDRAQITVTVNGQDYRGWLQSDVQRDMESLCGTFNIPVDLIPGQPPAIKRQDLVEIRIGTTKVATGYVLTADPFYSRTDCGQRVVGRDRTGDLVRCSAIHAGGQWRGASLDRIVRDLVDPFGLKVVVEADVGGVIADFRLSHGETVLDAISRAARLRGVLVTRNDSGAVLLTKAGTKTFRGSIIRGRNVISMEGVGSDENRHSTYIAYGQSNVVADFEVARGLKAQSKDAEMGRYLPLIVHGDGNTTQGDLQRLVDHTARVRRGHSLGFRYTIEGWTFDGEAWPLNQRVTIRDDIAGIDGDKWLISSVHHRCDLREGDVTDLVVRPVEAYDSVPLKSLPKRRNWGNKGNTTNHPTGPSDGARS